MSPDLHNYRYVEKLYTILLIRFMKWIYRIEVIIKFTWRKFLTALAQQEVWQKLHLDFHVTSRFSLHLPYLVILPDKCASAAWLIVKKPNTHCRTPWLDVLKVAVKSTSVCLTWYFDFGCETTLITRVSRSCETSNIVKTHNDHSNDNRRAAFWRGDGVAWIYMYTRCRETEQFRNLAWWYIVSFAGNACSCYHWMASVLSVNSLISIMREGVRDTHVTRRTSWNVRDAPRIRSERGRCTLREKNDWSSWKL